MKQARVKIVIIGGGSLGWTPTLLTDLALNEHLAGTVVLQDIDPVALGLMERIGRAIFGHRQAVGRFRLQATRNRPEALRGADFVVITISVGGLAMMRHDLEIPARYGVLQTVGDTVGPGGLMRGLRNVPVFVGLARQILRYCPGAWVLNYTNPMSVLTWTLSAEGCKTIGCCHEVFGTLRMLARLAGEQLGRDDLTRQDVDAVVTGINHCTFIAQARVAGLDAMELVREHIRRPGVLRRFGPDELDEMSVFGSREQIKFELLRRYGLLGAAGDRHLAEFFPGFITAKTQNGARWGIKITTIEDRLGRMRERLVRVRRQARNRRELAARALVKSGEEAGQIIQALVGRGELKTNINFKNMGQIPNLPAGAIVETNARISADRVEPLSAGPLPAGLLGALHRHVVNHWLIVEAGRTGERDLALQALLNDPLVQDRDDAVRMFEQMLRVQADYLPQFFPRRRVRRRRHDPSKLAAIDGAVAAGLPIS